MRTSLPHSKRNLPLCLKAYKSVLLFLMKWLSRSKYNTTLKGEVEGFEDFGSQGKTNLVANHVRVFMLRGLLKGWKQPIGYFLSTGPIDSDRLRSLLMQGLDEVLKKGMKVKVVIADQG